MTITAKVIADSVSASDVRLTTLQLRYPRFIHAEFMTHRVFSRNASSSRAIPVAKIIRDLRADLALPVSWGQNQKGMQAEQDVSPDVAAKAEKVWRAGAEAAIFTAEALIELGIHKQLANRVLEPWAHISVIVTATEWDNWFALRDHKDAQPEIAALAREMRVAMNASVPSKLREDEWHLPYVRPQDREDAKLYADLLWSRNEDQCHRQFPSAALYAEYMMLQISAARCARVSYDTHDGKRPEIADDIKLAERLSASKHMSPFEHQASPCICPAFHQNMRGWHTFRSTMEWMEKARAHAAQAIKNFVGELEKAGYEVEGIGRVQ